MVPLFTQEENEFVVPRNYKVPWLKEPWLWDLRPSRGRIYPGIGSRVRLRPSQPSQIVESLLLPGDKILELGCGRGKTVLALHAALSSHRLPALVVVPTTQLLQQWEERITEHTSIPKDRIGIIQGSKFRVHDCPIVLAVLDSVSIHQYPAWVYDWFRLVIFDECHTTGTPIKGRAAFLFSGERWGLTATLERSDGMHEAIKLHLGPVVYRDVEEAIKPVVWFRSTHCAVYEPGFTRDSKMVKAIVTNKLAKNERRNSLIISEINRAVSAGRTILVLGDRRGHLQHLMAGIDTENKGLAIGIQRGGKLALAMRQQVISQQQVIFSTTRIGNTGLDREELDTVFVLFPFAGEGSLRQTLGRALREIAGKKSPMAVVFVDEVHGRKTRKVFNTVIQEPGVWDGILRSMEENCLSLGYVVRRVG